MAQLLEESFKQSQLVPDLIQRPPHKTLKALFPAGGEVFSLKNYMNKALGCFWE